MPEDLLKDNEHPMIRLFVVLATISQEFFQKTGFLHMILPIFTVKKMKTHTKNFFSNDMKIITVNYGQFVVSDDNLLSFLKKKIFEIF